MTIGRGPALPLICHPPCSICPSSFSSSQMVERSTRHESYGGDTRRWPGKDGRRRGNVFSVRQADRGWTGPGRGPVRAAGPGAAGHQPLPGVRDSMSRWFARRHHARQPEPAAQPIERPAGTSHRHHDHHQRRQRRRWRAKRKTLIRAAVAIAYVFLTFTVLAFVLYQVWKLSLHVF